MTLRHRFLILRWDLCRFLVSAGIMIAPRSQARRIFILGLQASSEYLQKQYKEDLTDPDGAPERDAS